MRPTERNVKICHLSSVHNWYDERIFQKEAKTAVGAGYRVVFIVRRDSDEMVDEISMVALPSFSHRFVRLITISIVLLSRAIREKADIYQIHDPELIPIGLLLKGLCKRVVYDIHEDYQQNINSRDWLTADLRRIFSKLWWQFEKNACYFFDHLIIVATNIADKFPQKKKTVVTNAPPLSFVGPSAISRSGKFIIVYVGMIAAHRGIYKAIEALDLIKNRDIELHIMGAVKNDHDLQLFDEHPKVCYHGRVPWNELRDILKKADVGLLLFQPNPAHCDVSGEGNTKLFEYMGVGLPVVISDFPNLRAFISGIGAGVLVDPTAPAEIANAIDHLYENPSVRMQMGEKGRQAVLSKYNWENQGKKLLNAYEKVMLQ
jgi:glycosyltransferase involved in cell wall biosynthesis